MVQTIIDPTVSRRTRPAAVVGVAKKLDSLAGLRVGLLENTKRNAAAMLDSIGLALSETEGIGALKHFRKENFALPLPDALVEEIAAECDVVVIGVGDCGSCSASAVADGIALETLGLPTAVICTEAFKVTSTAMARVKGRPDFPFILTMHPVANLTGEQVTERAQTLVSTVRARLLGE